MCVGWCGSFHVLHLWQVGMKSKPNLEYHYEACASDYTNTGMHDHLCRVWVVILGSTTAILFVLPNICKRICNIYAYLHAKIHEVFLSTWRTRECLNSESNKYEKPVRQHRGCKNFAHHSEVPWGKTHFYMSLGWTLLTARCTFVYILQLFKSLQLTDHHS